MIFVTNKSQYEIEVAISTWGEGNNSFFPIGKDKNEYWNRTDRRGFIMSIRRDGTQAQYYIRADSNIIVTDNAVQDRGIILLPVSGIP